MVVRPSPLIQVAARDHRSLTVREPHHTTLLGGMKSACGTARHRQARIRRLIRFTQDRSPRQLPACHPQIATRSPVWKWSVVCQLRAAPDRRTAGTSGPDLVQRQRCFGAISRLLRFHELHDRTDRPPHTAIVNLRCSGWFSARDRLGFVGSVTIKSALRVARMRLMRPHRRFRRACPSPATPRHAPLPSVR